MVALRRLTLAFFIGPLLAAGLLGQPLVAAPLAPDVAAKVDALFAPWDRADGPGVIVAIARDGEPAYVRAFGLANLEHRVPLTPETITESGSVAKQFTAAAVALLAQRGQLSLEDPVRKWLPELAPELADRITVRMLLNHTSGLRDIHGLNDMLGRPSYTAFHDNAEVLRLMSRQRALNFAPGTAYLYTNSAYILAALVVERAAGRSFAEFCAREIFAPLGLAHTFWRADFTAIVPGRAAGYTPRPGGGFAIDLPYSNLIGNGGLFFTAGDLLKWNAVLDMTAGEWGAVARELQRPSRLADGRTIEYALGLGVIDELGVREVSHGGATAGYRTFLARFPGQHLSFALLSNDGSFNASAVARALARLLLDRPASPVVRDATVPAGEVAGRAGLYFSTDAADLVELTTRDGRLFAGKTELIPVAPGVFRPGAGRATWTFAADGRLDLAEPNGVTRFARVAPARPDAAALAACAGTYVSPELGVAWAVTVRDGALAFEQWPQAPRGARPTFADAFEVADLGHAVFVRGAAGAVVAFEISNGRCRRVRFERVAGGSPEIP